MDLGSLREESIKQPPRTENDEIRFPGQSRSCCRATPSTQPSCTVKRDYCSQQIDVRPIRRPQSSIKRPERPLPFRRSFEANMTTLQSIATTSKDIPAMTIAGVCVAIIHQHESIPGRPREGNTSFLDKSSNLLSSRRSTIGKHIGGLLSGVHRRLALAIEHLEKTKIWETVTSRASPLLANPPPLLVLAAIILFAFSLSHALHSQKAKKYRYRNYILGIGLLVGTVVGIWKTEERFLMEGKSYLAGSAVLALLVSWVVHGVFRIGGKDMRRNVRDCDCGCGCD
ncbi:hypothetical protein BKA61DRAFT_18701 [Leptodontidium sp. MPI-SDFR-AT-0119]|nr:hypothetical protein BKA61DRAFT_18701 [Leptodontidium sp. MPI-SDFR-AT-0119]